MSRPSLRVRDDGWSRLHLRWYCDDSTLWHTILDDFKQWFPRHGDRSYSASTKTWSVPRYKRDRLGYWADRWFSAADQEWADEGADDSDSDYYAHGRSGTGTGTGTGAGTGAGTGTGDSRAQRAGVSAVDRAYTVLHLRPSAPLWAAEAVYRAACKHAHPDAGGSHEAAKAVNEAIMTIRARQERRAS